MPTLNEAMDIDSSGFGAQLDELSSTIAFASARRAEEARLQGIYDQYNLDTANTTFDIGQMNR